MNDNTYNKLTASIGIYLDPNRVTTRFMKKMTGKKRKYH
jgi:hypothetical protein